jgi:hypothetical protein
LRQGPAGIAKIENKAGCLLASLSPGSRPSFILRRLYGSEMLSTMPTSY